MERARQADSGCEHWAEGKEIKRGCRMKIEVDKRKNQEHKRKSWEDTVEEKSINGKTDRLRTSPHQKQTNEITPADQAESHMI